MTYISGILVSFIVYCVQAIGTNLLIGYVGLTFLASGAFLALGAYSYALLAVRLHLPVWLALVAPPAVGGLCGVGLALALNNLSGDFYILATLAFQIVAVGIFGNLQVTGAYSGIYGIVGPGVLGTNLSAEPALLVAAVAVGCAVYLLARRLSASSLGLLCRGLREDELVMRVRGWNTRAIKVRINAVSGCFIAAGGAVYAWYVQYIQPGSFSVDLSFLVFAMVVIGGLGNITGSVVGAAIVTLLPEVLRFVGLPPAIMGPLDQMIFAGTLIAVVLVRPQGLIPERVGGEADVESHG